MRVFVVLLVAFNKTGWFAIAKNNRVIIKASTTVLADFIFHTIHI